MITLQDIIDAVAKIRAQKDNTPKVLCISVAGAEGLLEEYLLLMTGEKIKVSIAESAVAE